MKGYIYKITSPSTDKIYVGSTILSIKRRLDCHKKKSNDCSSSEIIKYGDAVIELLEEIEYENKKELRRLERKYCDEYKNVIVNINKPNLERNDILESKYKYRQLHKEAIREHDTEKIVCDCGSIINKSNKSRHFKTEKHQNYLNSLII